MLVKDIVENLLLGYKKSNTASSVSNESILLGLANIISTIALLEFVST